MAHGNNTISVPGELRSVASDGRALSADGVYDYNLNESQETINAEKADKSSIGVANGIASLDEDGHVPSEQIEGDYPNSVSGNVVGEFSDSSEVSFRPTAGAVDVNSGKAGKGAKLMSVKGNTVKWNQTFSPNEIGSSSTYNGVTYTNNQDGTISTSGTAVGDSMWYIAIKKPVTAGHKYLFKCTPKGGSQTTYQVVETNAIGFADMGSGVTFTANSLGITTSVRVYDGYNADGLIFKPELFDLTLIYGEGNEPETVAEFEADYQRWFGKPLTYEEYDEGSLRPVKMTGVKTVGFNAWDEEWEEGSISDITGENAQSTISFRSKNFIPVLPGFNYFVKRSSVSNDARVRVLEYDADKNYLGIYYNTNNEIAELSSKTRYIRFRTITSDTTYNHDICINLHHSGARDGEYEPYWTSMLNVPITTLKGKLNGEGSSVVVFPDGMKKAGTVYDEIVRRGDKTYAIKRIGSVDLGSLRWFYNSSNRFFRCVDDLFEPIALCPWNVYTNTGICNRFICTRDASMESADGPDKTIGMPSGYHHGAPVARILVRDTDYTDTTTFETAMLGVILYYQLGTPKEYLLDDFELPQEYDVDDYGTEEVQLGTNGCAPVLDIKYGINAGDTIKNLPHSYVSAVGEQSFTEAQKARARKNIGAASADEVGEFIDNLRTTLPTALASLNVSGLVIAEDGTCSVEQQQGE